MIKHKRIRSDSNISMVETPTAGDRVVDVIVILLCGLVAFCSVIPMWHVLMSSISDGKSLLAHNGLVLLPVGGVTLDGFRYIFKNDGIVTGYLNSIIYTVSATAFGFMLSAMTGYALSRPTKLKPIITGMTGTAAGFQVWIRVFCFWMKGVPSWSISMKRIFTVSGWNICANGTWMGIFIQTVRSRPQLRSGFTGKVSCSASPRSGGLSS